MASADKLKELLANINGRFDSIEMNSIAGGVLIEQGYNKNMIKVLYSGSSIDILLLGFMCCC